MTTINTAFPSTAMTFRSKAASISSKVIGATLAFALPLAASAQTFGAEVKAELDSAKPELWIVGGAVLALCVIAAVVNRGKSVTK